MAEANSGIVDESELGPLHDSNASLDLDNLKCRLLQYNTESHHLLPEIPELPLDLAEVMSVCVQSKQIFNKERSLLDLGIADDSNFIVVGTLHGNLSCLLKIFDTLGYPPTRNYLFLGNVIGENRCSLATLTLVLIMKLKYPNKVFLIRGKDESGMLIRTNISFRQECNKKYNSSVMKAFRYVFHSLPFAAVICNKIFCVNGGLSPELSSLEQIDRIERPIDCPSHGLKCDLIWSGLNSETAGWAEKKKSLLAMSPIRSYDFGGEMVSRFLVKNNFDLMCNAAGYREYLPKGYRFSAWKQLVTLFSAPLHKVQIKSVGAVLVIDNSLFCSFREFKMADLDND